MAKTVLITGSSKGLGFALALEFARNKYDVVIHGRNVTRLRETKKAVVNQGRKCDAIVGDITRGDTIIKLLHMAEYRNVSILINNAGIYAMSSIAEMPEKHMIRIIAVNLVTPMILIKRFIPVLKKHRNGGLIININSMAGKEYGAWEAAYCASKHGLRGFTNSVRAEAYACNVGILDIYPGAMITDMTKERKDYSKLMDPSDVAHSILSLVKDYKSLRVKEVDIGRRNY